jgi:nucleoside phosphorylase
MRRAYDIGLIIPLREEFDSAREILQFDSPVREGGYFFHPFSVPGSSVRGIAVVLFEMGQTTSAVAATYLLARFEIRMLALIGIAGALDPGLRLGDVLIASSVDEYMHAAKATPAANKDVVDFELGGLSWRAGQEIVNYAQNFRYLPDTAGGFAAWRERARHRRDPDIAVAIPALASEYPDYHVGAIATGEVVCAATAFARWLRSADRLRAAIEMEAGGVAQAIYRDQRDQLIIIRGISDFSDERKGVLDSLAAPGAGTGTWRRYAALNAMDLFAALVANPLFPWPKEYKTISHGPGQPYRPRCQSVVHAPAILCRCSIAIARRAHPPADGS